MAKDRSWARVAPADQRVKRHSIEITRHGRTWTGSYVVDIGRLLVDSAYGSRTLMTAGAKNLDEKAEKALAAIVDEYAGRSR